MYHRIGARVKQSIVPDQYVNESLLDKQLNMIRKKGYRSISLAEMEQIFKTSKETPEKLVVITFDDGYASFAEKAVPILQKHKMTATVFLVADTIGKTNAWDEARGDVTEKIMTRDQILKAHELGFEFGAHTCSHPQLPQCDEKQARHEIIDCRKELEASLQIPIEFFSYPFGENGERERQLVQEAGYKAACATSKKVNTPESDKFAWGRINVRATSSPLYLSYKMRKALSKDG
jgi:peptidoglycan/xylan/chitin deacetylase (PgdA/CDA1 family)